MPYIDGFLAPVRAGRSGDYSRMARDTAAIFIDHGELQVVESLSDDVPDGVRTDMWKAVAGDHAGGEGLAFSWIVWPSKAARTAGWEKAMEDARMASRTDAPFDPKRMIYGGFEIVVDTSAPSPGEG